MCCPQIFERTTVAVWRRWNVCLPKRSQPQSQKSQTLFHVDQSGACPTHANHCRATRKSYRCDPSVFRRRFSMRSAFWVVPPNSYLLCYMNMIVVHFQELVGNCFVWSFHASPGTKELHRITSRLGPTTFGL